MLRLALIALMCLFSNSVFAQDDLPPELQGIGLYEDLLPNTDDLTSSGRSNSRRTAFKQSIIPFISSSIPQTAADNIVNAEQVFCYHVTRAPKDYKGYTLNNFAIKDYCGELDISQQATTYEALFTQSPNIITSVAQCKINPVVMLRFIRGVDSTDVLLSSPCPSFTVFYAGKYHSFNIKQGIINDIISQFDKNMELFNSPALLKQTVANGKATNDKEAEVYEKKQRENAPIMNWKKDTETKKEEPKQTKGWGNIKLRK